MNPILKSALNYAQGHYKVFPIQYHSKSKQVLASWLNEASTDENLIYQWFENTRFNVGVRTGNGLVVIDVDNKNHKNGMVVIKKFMKEFPKTKIVKTPNNGIHIYYRVDREIHNKVDLYPGIDIRGEHGYVLGAGSELDNGKYELFTDYPIAQADENVYEFIEKKEQKKEKRDQKTSEIYQGQRNDTLFRLGCSLQRSGLSDEAIESCLILENQNRCRPPLEDKEVEAIIKSVFKYKKDSVSYSKYEGSYTSASLLNSEEADEPDIVEDMITVGFTLLGAPQKTGKTFFCLQLADAISSGNDFLEKKVQKGTSLYLAFEDKRAKLKRRLQTMGVEPKENFIIDVLKPNENYDLEGRVLEVKERHPDLRLVIIDTFQKIRKIKDRDYENDYKESTIFHELACKHGIAILATTHLRKDLDTNNPFKAIYGTTGLTAGADSILVMYKKVHISQYIQFASQAKDAPDSLMTLHQKENLTLEVCETESDDVWDERIVKIINFIVVAKEFIGSHEQLASKIGLNITGRPLQALMRSNTQVFKEAHIVYEILPRKNKARQIRLEYQGDETE